MPRNLARLYTRDEILHALAQALDAVDFTTYSDSDLLALTVFLGGHTMAATYPGGSPTSRRLRLV